MRTVLCLSVLVLVVGCKKKAPDTDIPDAPVMVQEKAAAKPAAPEYVQQMAANFSRVYFDYDASVLNAESKAALTANAEIMQKFADLKLEVQGHADERGTTDYNLALGQKRADSVVTYLRGMGVSSARVKVVSYGEERPSASGTSETAYAQNRRAEFVILYGGDGNVQGTAN